MSAKIYYGHYETHTIGNTTHRVFIPPIVEEILDRLSQVEKKLDDATVNQQEFLDSMKAILNINHPVTNKEILDVVNELTKKTSNKPRASQD